MDFLKFFKSPMFGVIIVLLALIGGLTKYSLSVKEDFVNAQSDLKYAKEVNQRMKNAYEGQRDSYENTIETITKKQKEKEIIIVKADKNQQDYKNKIVEIEKKYESVDKTPEVIVKITQEKSLAKMTSLVSLQCSLNDTCGKEEK